MDVLIVGAGAAGLLCAMEAGRRGRSVTLLDRARKPAEKVRISGGGRCNFTNLHASPEHFLSRNPRFCISALARYTPGDFIALVEKHGISYHEKEHGQLFCNDSSLQIVRMLLDECRQARVDIRLQTEVKEVRKRESDFLVQTSGEAYNCESLVVASGGLSIPKMGASGWGYDIAKQFGLAVVMPRPALVPFVLAEAQSETWQTLAGVALDAEVQCDGASFRGGLLFTHKGLSGPAMLQISSYWTQEKQLRVNLAPDHDVAIFLRRVKAERPRLEVSSLLTPVLPKRLAQRWAEQHLQGLEGKRLGELGDKQLERFGAAVNEWQVTPHGTEGYRTAEVTLGGVDTTELSSQTMESRSVPGLYFIGEVVDVTGHLGGFNFQWAWASGYAAGQVA